MTDEIWRLDEVARAGREHLDPEYVAAFDRKSPTDWTDDLAMLRDCGVGRRAPSSISVPERVRSR